MTVKSAKLALAMAMIFFGGMAQADMGPVAELKAEEAMTKSINLCRSAANFSPEEKQECEAGVRQARQAFLEMPPGSNPEIKIITDETAAVNEDLLGDFLVAAGGVVVMIGGSLVLGYAAGAGVAMYIAASIGLSCLTIEAIGMTVFASVTALLIYAFGHLFDFWGHDSGRPGAEHPPLEIL